MYFPVQPMLDEVILMLQQVQNIFFQAEILVDVLPRGDLKCMPCLPKGGTVCRLKANYRNKFYLLLVSHFDCYIFNCIAFHCKLEKFLPF